MNDYGVLCENCGFSWHGLEDNEYIQQSAIEPWDLDKPDCPECGEDTLVFTEPFCPVCQRTGKDACVCDDPEEERRQFEEHERLRNQSEEEKRRETEAIKEILQEKLQDINLEEERRKNREKRKEKLEHARKLLDMKANGDI